MAVSGSTSIYQPSMAPLPSPVASNMPNGNVNSTPSNSLGSDLFSQSRPAIASAPAAAPNFLATANPATAPMTPFMAPYGSFGQPQIMYIPVLQQTPPPDAFKPAVKSPSTEVQPGLSNAPELEAPPPGIAGEPPSAQAIGYKVGKSVEHLLSGSPELLDDADRLQLDDPDQLARQIHGAFHPLVKWVPDAILNKAVGQMPVEYQDMAGRLLDWLNTPESKLKPITSTSTPTPSASASRQPRPMSSVDHTASETEPPSSRKRSPLDDLSSSADEPIGPKSSKSKSSTEDPFADLFPSDGPAAEEKSSLAHLKDRLHLPSLRKDKAASEPSFEDLMI